MAPAPAHVKEEARTAEAAPEAVPRPDPNGTAQEHGHGPAVDVPEHLTRLRDALVKWAVSGADVEGDDIVKLLRLASARKLEEVAADMNGEWKADDVARASRYWWRRAAARTLGWTRRREEGGGDGFPREVDDALRALTREEWARPAAEVLRAHLMVAELARRVRGSDGA